MRIRIAELEPKAYALMNRLEEYLRHSDLTITHRNLIAIRGSQLNNCTYCTDLHITEAIESGESHRRIHVLAQWRNIPSFFTEDEQVVLQMTEEITQISTGLSAETYNKAMNMFSPNYVAQLILAIIVINSWNRIGVATHMEDVISL